MPRVDLRHTHPMFFVATIGDLIFFVGIGATLLLGPDRWVSSPNFDGIRFVLPLRLWGAVYLTIGAMFIYGLRCSWRWCRRALIIGAGVVMGWATSFLVLALQGRNTGVSGIFSFTAVAVLILAQAGEPPTNPVSAAHRE